MQKTTGVRVAVVAARPQATPERANALVSERA
jgi:hypothetical protein